MDFSKRRDKDAGPETPRENGRVRGIEVIDMAGKCKDCEFCFLSPSKSPFNQITLQLNPYYKNMY